MNYTEILIKEGVFIRFFNINTYQLILISSDSSEHCLREHPCLVPVPIQVRHCHWNMTTAMIDHNKMDTRLELVHRIQNYLSILWNQILFIIFASLLTKKYFLKSCWIYCFLSNLCLLNFIPPWSPYILRTTKLSTNATLMNCLPYPFHYWLIWLSQNWQFVSWAGPQRKENQDEDKIDEEEEDHTCQQQASWIGGRHTW